MQREKFFAKTLRISRISEGVRISLKNQSNELRFKRIPVRRQRRSMKDSGNSGCGVWYREKRKNRRRENLLRFYNVRLDTSQPFYLLNCFSTFLLFFSVSLFSYLQIHVAYHTADFYFLFGKRKRKKKEIWESRVKTSFDVDALKIGSLINIGKWGISSW